MIFAVFMIEAIYILIPTKSGKGFLKNPLGHNNNTLSSYLREHIKYDVSGLNGFLEVQTGHIEFNQRKILEEEVIQTISNYYGYPYELVSLTDFYLKIDHRQIVDLQKKALKYELES